jgi:hypothetical protein
MHRPTVRFVLASLLVLAGAPVLAQTSQPGDAVDVEVYNPADGSNAVCVDLSSTFAVRVFFRPGTGTTSCTLSCSPPDVNGGSANIATAVIDLAFDIDTLSYVADSLSNNPSTAAVQGIVQDQNVGVGRIGWATAGSWSTPGNPGSTLLTPCDMELLTAAGWLFEVEFEAVAAGSTVIHLRRETDDDPFALSFADICGSEAFKQSNGGIDEAIDAAILVADDCTGVLFFDAFETANADRWSSATGS